MRVPGGAVSVMGQIVGGENPRAAHASLAAQPERYDRPNPSPEVQPMTTLLALYRRPDGGPEAQATFEHRYAAEHLPLVAGTPGLRGTRVQRVATALGTETDLILITSMTFDDRAALDAGLSSEAMRAAGRNLREIGPGLATLLVVEDAPEFATAASQPVDTGGTTAEGPS